MKRVIDVLRETVSPVLVGRDVKEIGNRLYVMLDDIRRVEISLTTAGYADNYERILMKLVSKNHGELDCQGLMLKDIIGVGKIVSNDYKNGGYRWCSVSRSDLDLIGKSVNDYIEMWN